MPRLPSLPNQLHPTTELHLARARVDSLEKEVEALRERLLALADVLEPGQLDLLRCDLEKIMDQTPLSAISGWEDLPGTIPSNPEPELAKAWIRLKEMKAY